MEVELLIPGSALWVEINAGLAKIVVKKKTFFFNFLLSLNVKNYCRAGKNSREKKRFFFLIILNVNNTKKKRFF